MNYHFGVTPALSSERPTREDLINNDEMETYFYFSGAIYETKTGEEKRVDVIEKLRSIASEWSTEIGRSKSVQDEFIVNGGGIQLRIFGSTRLGVHNVDSDIDILCLAPSFISRGDFFTSFQDTLRMRKDVNSILSVPEAYTPVLKFIIDGQAIDMVFASLQLSFLPNNLDILDVRCLKGLDEASVRSINGSRVAEWICRLVPSMETFCSTLRAIKHWARVRGLYSNMLGFLGGINYAILVAYVCQAFVNACPYTLVRKFFEMYSIWKWPNPVMLRAMEDLQLADTDGRYLQVWNAQTNYKDALHIMPIITPAYPAMNSSYNVSPPQFRAFQDEILRGCSMFQKYHRNDSNPNGSNTKRAPFDWALLLETFSFDYIKRHPYFVQIDICAQTADEHRSWFGWVESRLRMLIVSLEQPPVVFCHPVANCFHRRSHVEEDEVGSSGDSPTPVPTLHLPFGRTNNGTDNDADAQEANGHNDRDRLVKSPAKKNGVESCASDAVVVLPSGANTKELKSSKDVNKQAEDVPEHAYISTFIIGLSFQKGSRFIDIEPPIQEFDYKVKMWAGKKPTMDLKISMFDRDSAPDFVRQTKPEPSNVSSCTPQTKRKQDQAHALSQRRLETVDGEVPDPAARLLFPTSAAKPALPRDRSDTSLSLTTEMSHSSISSNLFSDSVLVADTQRRSPRGAKGDSPIAAHQTRLQGKNGYMESALPVRTSSTSPPLASQMLPQQVQHLPPQPHTASPLLQVPPGFLPASMAPLSAAPCALSYRNAASAANGFVGSGSPRGVMHTVAPANGSGYVSPVPQYIHETAPGAPGVPYGYPIVAPPAPMGVHSVSPSAPGLLGTDGAFTNARTAMYTNNISNVSRMQPKEHSYLPMPPVSEHMMQQARPMPFPSMPPSMPPLQGHSSSPPKRVRKDGSSSSASSVPGANSGGSGNSSSSSLDGSNNNKASRRK